MLASQPENISRQILKKKKLNMMLSYLAMVRIPYVELKMVQHNAN